VIVPLHGIVMAAALLNHRVALKSDPVPGMLPARTHVYRVEGSQHLRAGEQVDAFLDIRKQELFDVRPAVRFVAGAYNPAITHVLQPGDTLPAYTLVDQRGRIVHLNAPGRVTLISFIFTRCPDANLCPAISAKFAYMQHHLDPLRFRLIEITLDPRYDSPAILARYGRQYGADAARWSLLTGEPAQVGDIIDTFGVASIQNRPGNFIHDDRLAIVDKSGKIAQIIPTAIWNPDDVIATARSLDGLSSNPLQRLELSAVAEILSLCGGSLSFGNVILDSAVFVLGVGILGSVLAWFGKQIFFVKEP